MYLQNAVNDSKRPIGNFMSQLYHLLNQGSTDTEIDNLPSIDMTEVTKKMKKRDKEYESWPPATILYKVEKAILEQMELERDDNRAIDEEIFAIDIREVKECYKKHKVEKLFSMKLGMDLNH